MAAHILSILELDRRFAAEAPKYLKVAERLRRQLLAREIFSGSTLDKRGRMFLHYTAPRSHALPESIEVLRDGSLRRVPPVAFNLGMSGPLLEAAE